MPVGIAITLEFGVPPPADGMALDVNGRWLPAESTVVIDPGHWERRSWYSVPPERTFISCMPRQMPRVGRQSSQDKRARERSHTSRQGSERRPVGGAAARRS